jgi:hypothetical protein
VRFGAHARNDGREGALLLMQLKAVCAPGDGGEFVVPVIVPRDD